MSSFSLTQRTFRHISAALAAFFILSGATVSAQQPGQVSGVIRDTTGLSVIAASVRLTSPTDTLQASTNVDGNFTFKNVTARRFTLTISSLGFAATTRTFSFDADKNVLNLPPIILKEAATTLDEVVVSGVPTVTIKEDTIEYRTKDLRLRDGALVEDALKKLDGVEVDKDGNVTAQGENITRVRINGKDYFGGDVKTATQNLPANIVERIQVVDDYGDMANITGNRTGDPERVLNIELSPGMNKGDFGNMKAGMGNMQRYQATAMYRNMNENQSLSVLGNLNNVNASLFDFNTRGGGARRMPGGGGFGRGSRMGGGFGSGAFGGGANGLTNTASVGIDYRNDFSKKLTMYGNYSYSYNDNETLSDLLNEGFFPDSTTLQNSNSISGTIGHNHRFDWNVEYRPDSLNYVKISPTFSLGNSDGKSFEDIDEALNGTPINARTTNYFNSSFTPNYGGSALYNRRLSQRGRNFFVNVSLNSSATNQDQERIINTAVFESANPDSTYQRQLVDLQNKGLNGGTSLSYTEPLGQNSSLEITYDYNFANYDNNREASSFDADGNSIPNPALSNDYTYSFSTNRAGATYRYNSRNIVYSIGASVQPSLLKGNTVLNGQALEFNRRGFNFVPVARFEYKFSRTRSFNVNYTGGAREPGFSQLQPITDVSDPNAPVTGNPNLAAEFNHNLRLRYNNFDWASGNVLFTNIDLTFTEDKIVTNRIPYVDEELGLIQETQYLNTSGYYTLRGFYHYSKPFNDRKYTLSFVGMANYNNNVAFTNFQKNTARNWILMQGLNFRINPTETLEITPGVRYTYNTTSNTRAGSVNNNVSIWALTLNGSVNLSPTWIVGADLAKTSNSGFSSTVGANPMIINTYLEKQFLKGNRGALRFSGFDLLNEQTNVSRSVTDNFIRDSRSNRLARYFMLTLSYRFQNFPGGGDGGFEGPRMRSGPGGPGMMGGPGGGG